MTEYWYALVNDDTWQCIDRETFYKAKDIKCAKLYAETSSKKSLSMLFPERSFNFLEWEFTGEQHRKYVTDASTNKTVFRLKVGIEDGEYLNEPIRTLG